jgi:hypothetical protein
MRNAYKISVGNHEGKRTSEDLGLDGRIILKWILGKSVSRVWIRLIWLRSGTSGGLLWTRYLTPGSIKCGEFLDWPNVLRASQGLCSMESVSCEMIRVRLAVPRLFISGCPRHWNVTHEFTLMRVRWPAHGVTSLNVSWESRAVMCLLLFQFKCFLSYSETYDWMAVAVPFRAPSCVMDQFCNHNATHLQPISDLYTGASDRSWLFITWPLVIVVN